MSSGETRYTVELDGTGKEMARLGWMGIRPEGSIIVAMTEAEYRSIHEEGNIRDRLAHRREVGDGLSFVTGAFDAGYHALELLDAYNAGNPDSPYAGLHDLDTLTVQETMALIRVTAGCLNTEMKIQPEDSGTTVTMAMKEEGLSPAAVFSLEDKEH